MHQAELVVHSVKRFGVAEKEISVRKKVVVEVLDDAPLRGKIEIDQDVAAENHVEALHESHPRIIREIQAVESHGSARRGLHLKLIANRDKVFLPVKGVEVPGAVCAVQGIL